MRSSNLTTTVSLPKLHKLCSAPFDRLRVTWFVQRLSDPKSIFTGIHIIPSTTYHPETGMLEVVKLGTLLVDKQGSLIGYRPKEDPT